MAAWKIETDDPPKPKTPSVNDRVEAARIREQHEARIDARLADALEDRRISSADLDEIRADAFKDPDTWNDNRLEQEFIRRQRPKPPGIAVMNGDRRLASKVIEAAVARKSGLPNLEKHFDVPTLEASEQHFRSGLSIVGLLHHSAQRNGWRGMPDVESKGFLRAAFGINGDGASLDIRAGTTGPSTYSVPTIIGNIANKFLKSGFLSVDNTWMRVAYRRSVNDFKRITTARLHGALIYRTRAPGREIKHGSLTESTYTNRAATYAILIGITREDLINDDVGAFTELSKHMGRGAGLKINDLFWTVFLNNSSFFTSGNNNVSTGGGSALGTADGAAINAAEVKFINQTDPNAYPVALMPRIMLVPPTLANTARRWMGSFGFVPSGTSGLGDSNIFQGRYNIATSPYMENTSYTGNSAAAWYLLADPNDEAVIEGVAIDGRWEPTVDTAEADFNQLGMAMRGFIDVGFAFKEPRAGVRSAGS